MPPAHIEWALLTDRQADAVSLAIQGVSQRQAARMLGVSRSSLLHRLEAAEHNLNREHE